MKLDVRQVARFCRDPGACRVVLLHGEDEGLIRERAQTLARTIAGSLNDPFLVVELARDGWARIPGEMAALSMIGGRRVIIVRDAADGVLSQVSEAMRGPGQALLVLEAFGLGKGKLRSFVEAAADGAVIACYPEEGRALEETIRAGFAAQNVSVERDALIWLADRLGGDRAILRREIEKLALFAGEGGAVTLDTALLSVGEGGSALAEDAIGAAMGGDLSGADAALEAALSDGLNGVALLRMALVHLQKMHQARLRMDGGASASDAVRAMRPPVFFRAVDKMTAALGLWPSDTLERAIEEARRLELASKQTGSKPELLAQRFIQSLARAAQLRRKRAA